MNMPRLVKGPCRAKVDRCLEGASLADRGLTPTGYASKHRRAVTDDKLGLVAMLRAMADYCDRHPASDEHDFDMWDSWFHVLLNYELHGLDGGVLSECVQICRRYAELPGSTI